jgi:hypothetical protein
MLYNMPNFLKQHPYRQSKAPQRPLLQLSSGVQPAVVMQVQQQQINLWRLGKAAGEQQLAAVGGEDGLFAVLAAASAGSLLCTCILHYTYSQAWLPRLSPCCLLATQRTLLDMLNPSLTLAAPRIDACVVTVVQIAHVFLLCFRAVQGLVRGSAGTWQLCPPSWPASPPAAAAT